MDRKKAIALSFSVPVAWGFSYPLMKIGMDSMNATSIVALRCIIAFVACLLLFHKRAFRINRDLMVRAAIIGAIMATELTCMCLGSSLTSASTAGFLQSLTVVIVPFANAALLRRAPERKVLVGTAIVTCGMLLLSGADFTSLNPGALIMLLSAFVYAGHIIVAKRFVENVDPLALGVWQLGFGGLFSGIVACVFGGFTLPSTPSEIVVVVALALICSAYGFITQTLVQPHVPAETTGFAFSLEPVCSAVFSFFLVGEVLSPIAFFGAALILNGELYQGVDNAAGEIGYMVPGREALRERFDEQGVLEALISGNRIVETLSTQKMDTNIRNLEHGTSQEKDLFASIERQIVETIGMVLINITAVFNEEIIVLGGGLGNLMGEKFLETWREMLQKHVPYVPRIETSRLQHRANILGAIAVAIRHVNDAEIEVVRAEE